MTSRSPLLEVRNLSFKYEGQYLLNQVSFTLDFGETATLIGVSGAGKTSLFKLITGILPSPAGSIQIAGDKQVAYMTQEDLLLPWRTVLENVLLPLELGPQPLSKADLRPKALQLLDELGLSECTYQRPAQLSGGMRQRVSLARALIQERPLLLLDEPFLSLDVILQEQMYALIKKMQAKRQFSMLLITHDFRDALSLADRILLLSKGQITQNWNMTSLHRDNPAPLQQELRAALLA